jgi:alkylated DNA repair dioxygenase AlkB
MSLISQNIILINQSNSKVTYQSEFLNNNESEILFNYLLNNIDWEHDKAKIYGKVIVTKRQIAWFADDNIGYNYSGENRTAKDWDSEVIKIKTKLEKSINFQFNSCLLNLYHNGSQGMAFHCDDQKDLQDDSAVAIISLGAERFFKIREAKNHPNQKKVLLEKGSLLLMTRDCQKHYQHEIPKMAAIKTPRISLTWRMMKS